MKIGVVIDQLIPGGVQISAIEEVKNLCRLGQDAQLLILMRKPESSASEYLVENIPYRYLSDSYPRLLRKTKKFPIFSFFSTLHLISPFLAPAIFKEQDYDILISHGTSTCFTPLALWKTKKIPFIAVIHDPISYVLKKVYSHTPLHYFSPIFIPLANFLEKIFTRAALATVIVSDVHLNFIKSSYAVEPFILPHGTQVSTKIPTARGKNILALSRWQKEKNPTFLLDLLKQLPKAKLMITGVWTNNIDKKRFEKAVSKYNLQKRVQIIDHFTYPELQTIFNKARVFVHPHFEAFGMGAMEAAAHGCPLIIPSGSGVTNLFRHSVHGYFPQNISLEEYKKYIKILLKNERLAYTMGKKAWQKVKSQYSWEVHTEKLLKLTEQCLKSLQKPEILALELGHAGGIGLSGGDKLFEEMVTRMPPLSQIHVLTSTFGARHWKNNNTNINLHILRPNPFEKGTGPISVFISYFLRIFQASSFLIKNSPKKAILYSSTNILPDILPAFLAKTVYPRKIWISRIHHLIPPPHKREGRIIVNIVSYLMQLLTVFCIKSKADLIIVLNDNLRKVLVTKGFNKEKIRVLGAGIDFKSISYHKPKQTVSYDGVYLGRLHVTKGIYDAVNIWKYVVKEKSDAKLAMIGAGPDSLKKILRREIKEQALNRNIKILGYLPQEQVYDILKSAKVFLFTDREAGWGLAVGEAMAARLPVVGYDIGVLGNVYKKGFKTVKLGDNRSFAQTVLSLLTDQAKREKLSREAYWQAIQMDWEITTNKFVKLLDKFANNSRVSHQ